METFIHESKTPLDAETCNDLIAQFEKHSWLQKPGKIGMKDKIEFGVEKQYKASTDMGITDDVANSDAFRPSIIKLFEFLNIQITEYKEKYPFLDDIAPWGMREKFNIQRYKPGEGYYAWHSEYHPHIDLVDRRVLAWMVYLNDVENAGTEFYGLGKIQAKQGSCAIWPAYWTHTHRGIVSVTQTKYIATGWYSFLEI